MLTGRLVSRFIYKFALGKLLGNFVSLRTLKRSVFFAGQNTGRLAFFRKAFLRRILILAVNAFNKRHKALRNCLDVWFGIFPISIGPVQNPRRTGKGSSHQHVIGARKAYLKQTEFLVKRCRTTGRNVSRPVRKGEKFHRHMLKEVRHFRIGNDIAKLRCRITKARVLLDPRKEVHNAPRANSIIRGHTWCII